MVKKRVVNTFEFRPREVINALIEKYNLEKDTAGCDLYLTEVVSQDIFVLQAMTVKEEALQT